MKFKQIRDEYYAQTAKASDVIRQLTYAGFGVIWIFKVGSSGIHVPQSLLPSAFLFTVTLLFDLCQYLTLARAWRLHAEKADQATESDDDEYAVPLGINVWGVRFYRAKAVSLGVGYAMLCVAILYQLLVN